MRSLDILDQAVLVVVRQPRRTFLSGLLTIVAVGTVVFVSAWTATSTQVINQRFDRTAASFVIAEGPTSSWNAYPADIDTRIQALAGVRSGGVLGVLENPHIVQGVFDRRAVDTPIIAITSGALAAVEPEYAAGGGFTINDERLANQVAVIGSVFHQAMPEALSSGIVIDGTRFEVIGVVEDTRQFSDLIIGVSVPRSTALSLWPTERPIPQAVVHTEFGAANEVARAVPYVVAPNDPDSVIAATPPTLDDLRGQISDELASLSLIVMASLAVLAVVGVVVGRVASVGERRHEIGVRRALGATRRDINVMVVAEAGLVGLVAATAGVLLGGSAGIAVALVRDVTPVLDLRMVAFGPLAGAATGVMGGLWPALRSMKIEPAVALEI